MESKVLSSIVTEPLTNEYISNNKDIIPDFQIIEDIESDFLYLYNNQLSEIKSPELLISILHKYGIIEYYKKILEYIICEILCLRYDPKNLCVLCSDIIRDLIEHNTDYSKILKYLIYQNKNDIGINDFLFSIQLLKSSPYVLNRYTSPEMPVKYKNMDVLKYLLLNDENDKCDKHMICGYAAKYGHFDILKWARENNCPWDAHTCVYAAENGHFEILKWAREQNCEWNSYVCTRAACRGHIDILKWAREQRCPWDNQTCTYAAIGGQLEILKYVRENGCPWNKYECLMCTKHSKIKIWIQSQT